MTIFDWACAWVQDQQSVWSQYEQDTFIWHNYLSHLGKNREKNVRARSLALSLPLFLSLTPCKHTNKRAQTRARTHLQTRIQTLQGREDTHTTSLHVRYGKYLNMLSHSPQIFRHNITLLTDVRAHTRTHTRRNPINTHALSPLRALLIYSCW